MHPKPPRRRGSVAKLASFGRMLLSLDVHQGAGVACGILSSNSQDGAKPECFGPGRWLTDGSASDSGPQERRSIRNRGRVGVCQGVVFGFGNYLMGGRGCVGLHNAHKQASLSSVPVSRPAHRPLPCPVPRSVYGTSVALIRPHSSSILPPPPLSSNGKLCIGYTQHVL